MVVCVFVVESNKKNCSSSLYRPLLIALFWDSLQGIIIFTPCGTSCSQDFYHFVAKLWLQIAMKHEKNRKPHPRCFTFIFPLFLFNLLSGGREIYQWPERCACPKHTTVQTKRKGKTEDLFYESDQAWEENFQYSFYMEELVLTIMKLFIWFIFWL